MIAAHDRSATPPADVIAGSSPQPGETKSAVSGLVRLLPLLRPHRGLVLLAVISLAAAALISLALPMAVRRMIDHGFGQFDGGFINSYFLMLLALAIALAIASACRYYFVTTLGERVVSDLRVKTFRNVTRLPASFFDVAAGSLGSLSEVWGELAQAAASAERLFELLDEDAGESEQASRSALSQPAKGAIEIRDLHFAYPGAPDRQVLTGLSMIVRSGETVALVGASGSGKSTIFSLMLGFYKDYAGDILLDGCDARTISTTAVRGEIAVVPQDVTIFATSIAENISLGRSDASLDEIVAAATVARAHGFISELTDGYRTVVGERGLTLSGGQRQRLAIARAVLKNAPILLLDEATASLDSENEMLVQRGLDELMSNRTTIVIAHRLATVLKADRILVLDGGRVIEEGTHAALTRKGGAYSRLAELQFDLSGSAAMEHDAA